MSNKNEFEELIQDFKLGDAEKRQSPASRKAFNYDEDDARFKAAKEYTYTAAPLEPVAVQSARPAVRSAARPRASARKKRDAFEVQIDDNAFYQASPSSAVNPQPAGGGGSNGGGSNRNEEPEESGGGANRWIKAIVVLLAVLGVSVFLAFFALESAGDLFGLNKPDNQIEVVLPKDLSISEIASLLKDDGVIKQPLTFQLYAGLKNKSEHFIPGTYVLNSNMSYDEIMVAFRTGNTKKIKVMLMFYEGMTLSEIADKLEENRVCSKADLLAYLEAEDFPWEYKFLEQVPQDELRFRRYEGYFFPDTYEFYEGMSPTDVTRKFFSNFNNKIDEEMFARMEELGMTLDETIILASIIQREVGNPKDMADVSSVFHNRLKNTQTFPNLQSDTTREYVESDIKPYMTQVNQPLYDAYNSDMGKRVGLPAGPISNPGLDAIRAALYPSETPYYFFVNDLEGRCYYAVTDAEHERNKAIAEQRNQEYKAAAAKEQK